MSTNYDLFLSAAKLDDETALLEEAKNYIKENVLITEIGIIQSFNEKEQKGVVIVPKYKGLKVSTVVFSSLRIYLNKGDKVLLIQSSVDLFDERGTNYFDKNNFYILAPLKLKKAELNLEEFSIKTKSPIEISVGTDSLKDILSQIVTVLNGMEVTGQAKLVKSIDPSTIKTKINKVLK